MGPKRIFFVIAALCFVHPCFDAEAQSERPVVIVDQAVKKLDKKAPAKAIKQLALAHKALEANQMSEGKQLWQKALAFNPYGTEFTRKERDDGAIIVRAIAHLCASKEMFADADEVTKAWATGVSAGSKMEYADELLLLARVYAELKQPDKARTVVEEASKNILDSVSNKAFVELVHERVAKHLNAGETSPAIDELKRLASDIRTEMIHARLGEYIQQVEMKVRRRWNPGRLGETGDAIAVFQVDADGKLVRTELVQTSGIQTIDDSVISAVLDSAPFPEIPTKVVNQVTIKMTFHYTDWSGVYIRI